MGCDCMAFLRARRLADFESLDVTGTDEESAADVEAEGVERDGEW